MVPHPKGADEAMTKPSRVSARLASEFDRRLLCVAPAFLPRSGGRAPVGAIGKARIPATLTNHDRLMIRAVRRERYLELKRLRSIYGHGEAFKPPHLALIARADAWGSFEALAEKFDVSVAAIREVVRRRWCDIELPDGR